MKKTTVILFFSLLLTITSSFAFVTTQDFRDIYLDQLLQFNANYSDEDLNQIIIPLRTDFLDFNFTSIEELDEFFINQNLNTFVDQTISNQPKQSFNINDIKETITFVLVPGLLSEFVSNEYFEDIFEEHNKNSSFRKKWKKVNRRFRIPRIYDPRPKDKTLDLDAVSYTIGENAGNATFKTRSQLLSNLIDVTSIDNNGKALVKLIRLKVSFLSLETLGSIKDSAKNYNRRLAKFFKQMGKTSKNIYLLGHSRGTLVSLEMLAQAKKSNSPWLRNTKGMISLAGVVLGTHDADGAFYDRKDNPEELHSRKQMKGVKNRLVGNGTEEYPGLRILPYLHRDTIGKNGSEHFRKNWEVILSNLEQYRLLLGDLKPETLTTFNKTLLWKIPKGTSRTKILKTVNNRAWPIFKKIISMLIKSKKSSTDKTDTSREDGSLFGLGKLIYKVIFKNFETYGSLTSVNVYNKNILRTLKIVKSLLTAVEELTTEARKDWWRNVTLPEDIRFYTIAGTGDGGTSIFNDNITFNREAKSCDRQLNNHKNFYTDFVYKLNDGAVPSHRTMFFPSIIKNLNPNLDLKFTFLGLAGTTHWGLSLPYVLGKGGNRKTWNPYPRETLVKALAIALNQDLNVL